jgi:hypothetical protein
MMPTPTRAGRPRADRRVAATSRPGAVDQVPGCPAAGPNPAGNRLLISASTRTSPQRLRAAVQRVGSPVLPARTRRDERHERGVGSAGMGRRTAGPGPRRPRAGAAAAGAAPQFLAEAGWDPVRRLLAPPRDHPLLGLRECAVADCQAGRASAARCCAGPATGGSSAPACRWRGSWRCRPARPTRALGETLCRVAGCQRPTSGSARLYAAHARQRRTLGITVEAFLARDDPVPKPSFGDCQVVNLGMPRIRPPSTNAGTDRQP